MRKLRQFGGTHFPTINKATTGPLLAKGSVILKIEDVKAPIGPGLIRPLRVLSTRNFENRAKRAHG